MHRPLLLPALFLLLAPPLGLMLLSGVPLGQVANEPAPTPGAGAMPHVAVPGMASAA